MAFGQNGRRVRRRSLARRWRKVRLPLQEKTVFGHPVETFADYIFPVGLHLVLKQRKNRQLAKLYN